MLPFFFAVSVIPTAGTPQSSDIEGATAHIWVMANSPEEAETKARSYLMDYAWIVKEVEIAIQPRPEQIAHLGIEETLLHEKARRLGIAADFLAWPKVKRPSDTPIEVRLMESRPNGGSDQEQ